MNRLSLQSDESNSHCIVGGLALQNVLLVLKLFHIHTPSLISLIPCFQDVLVLRCKHCNNFVCIKLNKLNTALLICEIVTFCFGSHAH